MFNTGNNWYGGQAAGNWYMPPNSYQQYASPPQKQTPQPMGGNNGLIWVQGEEGAKGYMVAPGASVLLMDSEKNAFYIKETAANGMPAPLRIFDYTERAAPAGFPVVGSTVNPASDFVTRTEFNDLLAKIEKITTEEKDNG